ncbi:MAG: M24 family metallopeptidase [Armatimonadetes bacterium]|nr:M24 family metallopeptidase [Armatimonadota bacterium]
MLIEEVQEALREEHLNGWLFYDLNGLDPIGCRILGLDPSQMRTRRWFYLIPQSGEPRKLVHRIESQALFGLPGSAVVYTGWRDLEPGLKTLLDKCPVVAMQYSPWNAIPYVSRVDAGTLEMIRSLGVEVRTSADLVQRFEARWSAEQLETHLYAASTLRSLVDRAFFEIARRVRNGDAITELDLQSFLLNRFKEHNLHTDSPPIVAVNAHTGNPHYEPGLAEALTIREGDFVLLDLWAKKKEIGSVYADMTRVGFVGTKVPEKYQRIFRIVREARDRAVAFVGEAVRAGRTVRGWEVDDVARNWITEQGFGENFFHRTGHSIGESDHGFGANMDNFETRDERKILPQTCFSVEPGIYFPEFGVRSEVNVYVGKEDILVSGAPIQTEVVPLLREHP